MNLLYTIIPIRLYRITNYNEDKQQIQQQAVPNRCYLSTT